MRQRGACNDDNKSTRQRHKNNVNTATVDWLPSIKNETRRKRAVVRGVKFFLKDKAKERVYEEIVRSVTGLNVWLMASWEKGTSKQQDFEYIIFFFLIL